MGDSYCWKIEVKNNSNKLIKCSIDNQAGNGDGRVSYDADYYLNPGYDVTQSIEWRAISNWSDIDPGIWIVIEDISIGKSSSVDYDNDKGRIFHVYCKGDGIAEVDETLNPTLECHGKKVSVNVEADRSISHKNSGEPGHVILTIESA